MADIDLVIKIPEDCGVDVDDKFQNFFTRLRFEITRHLMTNTSLVCGAYELETIDILMEAFAKSTPIRKGRWVDDHCSVCGCDIPAYMIDWRWQKDMDAKWCPMCGAKIEAKEIHATVDIDAWCNTCESKYLETDCLGCAKYDEYNNLIALTHYKKESEDEE